MRATVQRLLESFDELADEEKRELTVEILRRSTVFELGEDDLLRAADEVFLALDEAEGLNGAHVVFAEV